MQVADTPEDPTKAGTYTKDSFFDEISCETLDRKTGVLGWGLVLSRCPDNEPRKTGLKPTLGTQENGRTAN